MTLTYDIIVIGAGHAGCEAAAAAATMGSKVLLITMDMTKMAQMSCNPAIGGIAKGQIVREIDALGGLTGIITDKTSIQFRMLNRSKGPAMWSPRSQSDRTLFTIEWRKQLENTPNLDFWQDGVKDVFIQDGHVAGVKTLMGTEFYCNKVIITAGTFLNGLIHVGYNQLPGGRSGEKESGFLTEVLQKAGIETGRMKTGTPARLDGRTIDFCELTEQRGDITNEKFSYLDTIKQQLPQRSCFITHTNIDVHNILRQGFSFSPLFNGVIKGIGPRYCPSIEDKIVTFNTKDSHQLFLEPEGLETNEYYLNGFSSSLPINIQYAALRRIKGLENVKIFRAGYAIEYDFFQPTQLLHTLESKHVAGLYFAGQVNGTTGYEEAAAQGLMAGINASLSCSNLDPFVLNRNEAYIGVLIDDLVTKGVDEPYRMFTSRAEFRILLRQDNADDRLTEKGYSIGLGQQNRYDEWKQRSENISKLISFCGEYSIVPSIINPYLQSLNTPDVIQKQKLGKLLLRPQLDLMQLKEMIPELNNYTDTEINGAQIQIKYEGYIRREESIAEKATRLEYVEIPSSFNFDKLLNISTEGRQKLNKIRPATIGQASRISGVSPSDINVLLIHLGR